MHAYTIAVTLAMAGSSVAAVIQNPPSTSTTTVTADEIRAYGPTCAGFGPDAHGGPTCAGVGPAAHTPPAKEKEDNEHFDPLTQEDLKDLDHLRDDVDVDHDGDFDHQDMEHWRAVANEPKLPEHVEPPTVRVATKTCPECPKCTKCPHPSEHNPKWDQMALLNDTRKNINGFKLFAQLNAPPSEEFPPRFAVHVREHVHRKDIWDIKLFPSAIDDMIREIEDAGDKYKDLKKMLPPSARASFEEMESFNAHQPRWNLADNRLETRSNNSAPVNDTLYLRLFEDKPDVKDTSQFHGAVYRSMLTTNPNKNKYKKENNAKLIAKKSWQLKRDSDAPWYYTLLNKDIQGNFFWCIDQGKLAAMEAKSKSMMAKEESSESSANNQTRQVLEALQVMGDHQGAELRFMSTNETEVQLSKGKTNCMAVTLKAEQWIKA